MTLGPEQRALLQLLLERDQSYDDIAAVLGADREEARSRARSALAALAGREPDAELTDYLLGQAGPVERADVARRLRRDPESLELSARLLDELRAVAPRARLPALPQPADLRSRADTGARARAGAEEGTEGLERRQRRMLLGLAAVAVLVFAVVGAVAGLFGGGDEPAPGPTADSEEPEDAVAVRLEPRGRTDVGGRAVLGLATGDQPFIDVTLEGLEPIPPDDAYVIWLMITPARGWPLSPLDPDRDGEVSAVRFPIPSFLLQSNVVKRLRSLVISRSPRAQLLRAADAAAEKGVAELDFVGVEVASGDLPAAVQPAPQGSQEGA